MNELSLRCPCRPMQIRWNVEEFQIENWMATLGRLFDRIIGFHWPCGVGVMNIHSFGNFNICVIERVCLLNEWIKQTMPWWTSHLGRGATCDVNQIPRNFVRFHWISAIRQRCTAPLFQIHFGTIQSIFIDLEGVRDTHVSTIGSPLTTMWRWSC